MKGRIYASRHRRGYTVRFGRDITRHFVELEAAERFLNGLRFKVDEGIFDPRDYATSRPNSLRNQVEKWLEIKKKQVKRKSYNNLNNYMRQAIEAWGPETNVKAIGYAEIEDFLVGRKCSDKTKSNMKSCLHDFWLWLKRRKVITLAQVPEFPEVKFELGWREIIDIETQQAVIAKVKELSWHIDPKIYIGIRLLATYIKIRPGELTAIKERQLDLKQGAIIIPHPKEKQPKMAWLALDDIELLGQIPRGLPDLPFFRHPRGIKGATAGEAYGQRYLYKWWKKACMGLGLKGVDLYGGTRHSTTTALGERLTNEQVQDATGHASAAFRRYFQGEQKRAMKATAAIKDLCKQHVNNISEELITGKLFKFKE
jgi:integrase